MKGLFRGYGLMLLALQQCALAQNNCPDGGCPYGYESLEYLGFGQEEFYGYLTRGRPAPLLFSRGHDGFDRKKLFVINPGIASDPTQLPPPMPPLTPFTVSAGVLDPQNPQNNFTFPATQGASPLPDVAQSALVFLQQPVSGKTGTPGATAVLPFNLPLNSMFGGVNPPPVRSGAQYTLSP